MTVYPQVRYLNEAKKANGDIYDDCNLKKSLWSLGLYNKYFGAWRVTHEPREIGPCILIGLLIMY